MSLRHDLATALAPLLPAEWRIIPYERDIDPPSTVVVMLRQKSLRYDTNAGFLLAIFKVSIISPHTDSLQNAEDALDDGVHHLLDGFLKIAEARIPTGNKTRFGKKEYPAWDIDLEVPLERKL